MSRHKPSRRAVLARMLANNLPARDDLDINETVVPVSALTEAIQLLEE